MHLAAQRIIDLYERNADAWDRKRSRSDGAMECPWLDRFLTLVPEGGRVLDIGCGAGVPVAAHVLAKGRSVTGIDAAPSMIALCRQRFASAAADWCVADMRALDLGRRCAGLIAWDSFFHISQEDQRRMFAVFDAHAQQGAPLLFTSGPAAGEAIGEWMGEPLYHASLDPAEYRHLLTAHGFDVVDFVAEDPACGGHTVWLARARGGRNPGRAVLWQRATGRP